MVINNDDKNEILSDKKYLDEIKPYLKDIMDNLRKSDTRKILLAIAINLISSNDMMESIQCIQRVIS